MIVYKLMERVKSNKITPVFPSLSFDFQIPVKEGQVKKPGLLAKLNILRNLVRANTFRATILFLYPMKTSENR